MNNSKLTTKLHKAHQIQLSHEEKGSLRLRFAQYMTEHPLSQASPFMKTFRYVSVTAFALIILIGSGSLVTFASQSSLPGELLYPVKLTSEKLKQTTIKQPEAKIAYSLALLDKRYTETNKLIETHSLDQDKEVNLTKDIQKHVADIQLENEKLAQTNPAQALSVNTRLAQALKTNTQVLLAVSEKNQNSSISSQNSLAKNTNTHAKIVLAAYESAAKISLKTEQLQEIVLSDTDIVTVKTAEKKYEDILPKLELALTAEIKPAAATLAVVTPTKEIPAAKVLEKTVPEANVETTETVETKKQPEPETLKTLSKKLHAAYEAKEYNQVIVIADQIDQKLTDAAKIKKAEKTYDIIVPEAVDVKTSTETKPATPVSIEKIDIKSAITTTVTADKK